MRRAPLVPFTERYVPKSPLPPPPSAPQGGLDEVERALSTLKGRHPEHERTERETREAGEKQRLILERKRAERTRRAIRRALLVIVNAAVIGGAGWVGWKLFARAQGVRADLKPLEARWAARGFAELGSNMLTASPVLKVDAPGSSCFAAVSTSEAPMRVRAGAATLEGSRAINWCACGPGLVSIEATQGAVPVGLALLRIDARATGGILARANPTFPASAWIDGGQECADATLDGWIAERLWPKPALDAAWLTAAPARAALAHAGFRLVSALEPARPLGVVEAAAGDCMLAVSTGDEELSLRVSGGQWLLTHAHGALAWCDSAAATTSVWREGASPVVVLEGSAAAVGGLLGVREVAEAARIHVAPGATWLKDADLTWDVGLLLRASKLSDVTQGSLPTEPATPTTGVVALALAAGATVAEEPEGVLVACDPRLDSSAGQRESVCAHAAPVAWWRRSDVPASWAHAPVPLWLTLLEPHHEPDAIARIPELVALARRLGRDGFEPTMLEGVTELPEGVRIIGRAHEDAVVAVGLGPGPPWVFPYTDKVPWDMGDAPRVVALLPGSSVTLKASPPPSAPEAMRRTIVFRHGAP